MQKALGDFRQRLGAAECVKWSESDEIATCTRNYVHVISDVFNPVPSRSAISFDRPFARLRHPWGPYDHSDPHGLHSLFLSKTLDTNVRCMDWSPSSCASDRVRCMIAIATNDFALQVYDPKGNVRASQWAEVCDVSRLVYQHMEQNAFFANEPANTQLRPVTMIADGKSRKVGRYGSALLFIENDDSEEKQQESSASEPSAAAAAASSSSSSVVAAPVESSESSSAPEVPSAEIAPEAAPAVVVAQEEDDMIIPKKKKTRGRPPSVSNAAVTAADAADSSASASAPAVPEISMDLSAPPSVAEMAAAAATASIVAAQEIAKKTAEAAPPAQAGKGDSSSASSKRKRAPKSAEKEKKKGKEDEPALDEKTLRLQSEWASLTKSAIFTDFMDVFAPRYSQLKKGGAKQPSVAAMLTSSSSSSAAAAAESAAVVSDSPVAATPELAPVKEEEVEEEDAGEEGEEKGKDGKGLWKRLSKEELKLISDCTAEVLKKPIYEEWCTLTTVQENTAKVREKLRIWMRHKPALFEVIIEQGIVPAQYKPQAADKKLESKFHKKTIAAPKNFFGITSSSSSSSSSAAPPKEGEASASDAPAAPAAATGEGEASAPDSAKDQKKPLTAAAKKRQEAEEKKAAAAAKKRAEEEKKEKERLKEEAELAAIPVFNYNVNDFEVPSSSFFSMFPAELIRPPLNNKKSSPHHVHALGKSLSPMEVQRKVNLVDFTTLKWTSIFQMPDGSRHCILFTGTRSGRIYMIHHQPAAAEGVVGAFKIVGSFNATNDCAVQSIIFLKNSVVHAEQPFSSMSLEAAEDQAHVDSFSLQIASSGSDGRVAIHTLHFFSKTMTFKGGITQALCPADHRLTTSLLHLSRQEALLWAKGSFVFLCHLTPQASLHDQLKYAKIHDGLITGLATDFLEENVISSSNDGSVRNTRVDSFSPCSPAAEAATPSAQVQPEILSHGTIKLNQVWGVWSSPNRTHIVFAKEVLEGRGLRFELMRKLASRVTMMPLSLHRDKVLTLLLGLCDALATKPFSEVFVSDPSDVSDCINQMEEDDADSVLSRLCIGALTNSETPLPVLQFITFLLNTHTAYDFERARRQRIESLESQVMQLWVKESAHRFLYAIEEGKISVATLSPTERTSVLLSTDLLVCLLGLNASSLANPQSFHQPLQDAARIYSLFGLEHETGLVTNAVAVVQSQIARIKPEEDDGDSIMTQQPSEELSALKSTFDDMREKLVQKRRDACPICREGLPFSPACEQKCSKGHPVFRCSLTLALLPGIDNRCCKCCERRYLPLGGSQSSEPPQFSYLSDSEPVKTKRCLFCNVSLNKLMS